MITNALIQFIRITIIAFLGWIPAVTLPTILTDVWETFVSYLGYLDAFIPVTTFISVIGVLITLEGGFLIWKIIKFIINIARGSGV